MARKMYDDFSRRWRRDARLADRYGKPGTKKPRFSDLWHMHQKQLEQMRGASPEDVREYMGDPWAEPDTSRPEEPAGERGVLTIPIAGDE
jgi:hypothetical protein